MKRPRDVGHQHCDVRVLRWQTCLGYGQCCAPRAFGFFEFAPLLKNQGEKIQCVASVLMLVSECFSAGSQCISRLDFRLGELSLSLERAGQIVKNNGHERWI